MTGSHRIQIENKRLRYDFTIRRNITVIRGESATGKTTLLSMLQAYETEGRDSGISIHADCPCAVFNQLRWMEGRNLIHNTIVFVDENQKFISSEEFARSVAKSDNYFVLVTRERLENLPYSVDEIYGIRISQKYAGLKKTYNEFYRIYYPKQIEKSADIVVTEDSGSGHQFFQHIYTDVPCLSAHGKSNIAREIRRLGNRTVLVIADGAAFGPEMERMEELIQNGYNLILYLPESFEWMILTADVLKDSEVRKILLHPENFIKSEDYVSWERYFTHLLTEKTAGTCLHYSKTELNRSYLDDPVLPQLKKMLPDGLVS